MHFFFEEQSGRRLGRACRSRLLLDPVLFDHNDYSNDYDAVEVQVCPSFRGLSSH